MPRKLPQEDPLLLESPLAPQPRRTRVRRSVSDALGVPAISTDDVAPKPSRRSSAQVTDVADIIAASAPSPAQSSLRGEILGIVLLVGSLFIAGALVFGRTPAAFESCTVAGGAFGPVGGCMRWAVLGLVGAVAAVIVPFIPAVRALRALGRLGASSRRHFDLFPLGLVVLIPIATGLARLGTVPAGTGDTYAGLWGSLSAYYLSETFGRGGAWFALVIAVSVLTAVTLGWNPLRALVAVGTKSPAQLAAEAAADAALTKAEVLEPDAKEMPEIDLSLMGITAKPDTVPPKTQLSVVTESDEDIDAALDEALDGVAAAKSARAKKPKKLAKEELEEIEQVSPIVLPNSEELPSPTLLTKAPERNVEAGRAQLDAMGAKLIESLRTFKVDGVLSGRTSGPTVTQYEIEPAPGVKVRQFANLANDLALAMRAPSIRVVAPIPGKGAVGVEVPNPSPEMVAFREMLESTDYQNKPMALPIALGKDLEGSAVIADLAKMPHLLIAGATGSGKSVCVNTIITSLIYRHTPKTLRFLMVDPKMVELSVYNVLPHLRHKVVTDNRDAAAVLKWAVLEMQERYALLAENGARNIQDFNAKVRAGAALKKPKDPNVGFENREYTGGILPYIVVVIDELADLMMTVAAEVETPLAMLAQKARAIGIHLILATQRPSVNVITGLIKANFPSRIAFRVASQIDSRTIIDGMGAESLLGNGDMLFIPPGKSEPSRLQGAFLSNDDTERLMQWYVDQKESRRAAMEAQGLIAIEEQAAEADILEAVRAREALEAGAGEEASQDQGDRDKLFREAAEVCVQHQGGSTSLLQRRLKIGYGRAARIIDQLHLAGVLGPPDGSKPRDVLIGLEDIDRIAGERTAA